MTDQIKSTQETIQNDPYKYSLFKMLNKDQWAIIREALYYEATAHDVNSFNDCDDVTLVGKLYMIIQAIDRYLTSDNKCFGLLTSSVGNKLIYFMQEHLESVLTIWEDCYTVDLEQRNVEILEDELNLFKKYLLLKTTYNDLFGYTDTPCSVLMMIDNN